MHTSVSNKSALALFLLLSASGFAADLNVDLQGAPAEGVVILSLFDSANTFGDLRDPVREEKFTLSAGTNLQIKDVPAGEYALMVHYDENNNGVLDRNFIGIPREPIGFSNGYRPKGPPSYSRASFVLGSDEQADFSLPLTRPLGKRGRIGVGVGVIGRSSPYLGYDGAVYRVIPALSYNGERFQLLGPVARLGLVGSDTIRLAATAAYRIGPYEEDDSPALSGLGNRKDTLMAGLALVCELPVRIDASVGYEHDVLNKVKGGTARAGLDRSVQLGLFRINFDAAVNLLSADLADNDYGVPADRATPDRPAYEPGASWSVEFGVGTFVELSRDWSVIASGAIEFLDDTATDSPIVSESSLFKGFAALAYVF